MTKLNVYKRVCLFFLLGVGTAIASHGQTFTTLVNFGWTNGANPGGVLVQGLDGDLYGTTSQGGAYTWGTVFKITTTGTLTTLYSFNLNDGAYPGAALLQATDGNFYGTTGKGGAYGYGTIFKITRQGSLTTLHSFCSQRKCIDGGEPSALVEASDGNFYGTTTKFGANGKGSIFKITPQGKLTPLYSFCAQAHCPDGMGPEGLVEANGNFSGTTLMGGANASGTIFKMTPEGKLTTLHSFCSQANCADGWMPSSGLMQATSGRLYGTTRLGGANCTPNGCGTIFEISPAGALTTVYSFCAQANCTDGYGSEGGLFQATDGSFYGTFFGGANDGGTVFRITPKRVLTTLYSFCSQANCGDGTQPSAGLLQATNGNFYGTAFFGGTSSTCPSSCGTVFSLSMGLDPFVALMRNFGKVGSTIGILGQGFTGATDVSVNGTAAAFTVVSDTYLTAKVPSVATTGFVTVTTPSGTLTSNKQLVVKP